MKRIISILLVVTCVLVPSLSAKGIVQPAEPNKECQSAWEKYKKADALWKTGWGLFGAGLGLGMLAE